MEWRNWAGTVVYRNPKQIYRPRSLEEARNVIKETAARGYKVRAVGSGHAWSQLGLSGNGAIIITDELNKPLTINEAEGTVKVEGGIKTADLNEWLFANELALPNMGDTDRQSIAGAIANDTHGSGRNLGSLSELVRGMELVTADGNLYDVPEDELPAARVAHGKLGLVYSLTLDVVSRYFLRHERNVVKFREEKDLLDGLLSQNRNLEYWYYRVLAAAVRDLGAVGFVS